ncbi:MAG: hypothetical protein HWQ35_21655 [Nostoc sp. NMS1]|uniref:hypothetical protein n=1 Tax=unclassified Nostoc TaxID=2593658 RepID=UPI0025F90B22|nr:MULTISPECIES: hypothetical protein [unclassified Nostoc]MBN3909061.1 hypothetical protein [Nostoc sp. NMS1]MBN3992395.1 hypothetical protein [Nostoc sp. NMS2]
MEQLFATLKTAGLNLEATQLESIAAIQRLTVLALSVAVRILQRKAPALRAEGRRKEVLIKTLVVGYCPLV